MFSRTVSIFNHIGTAVYLTSEPWLLSRSFLYPLSRLSTKVKNPSKQSKWTISSLDKIPLDDIEKKFVRSSGPGGQNVNKVNTKCEIRFKLSTAAWIPEELRDIFRRNYSRYLSGDGTVVVQSEKSRSQHENFEDCIQKLLAMLKDCEKELVAISQLPSEEDLEILKQRAEKAAECRLLQKRFKSQNKRNRSSDF